MKAVALWSGGKDSCLACYEAISNGFEITYLLNFIFKGNHGRSTNLLSHVYRCLERKIPKAIPNLISFIYRDLSRMVSHEISPEIIIMQARAMDIPIIQKETSWSMFENQLKLTMLKLKSASVESIIIGLTPPHYPLDNSEKLREYKILTAHKNWFYRICNELGIKPITPLWQKTPEQNLVDFIKKGFEAIIIAIDPNVLDIKWLGHNVDCDFLKEMMRLNRESGVHIGGSGYHTLVIDGPIFKKRLHVHKGKIVYKNGYFVFDILKAELL